MSSLLLDPQAYYNQRHSQRRRSRLRIYKPNKPIVLNDRSIYWSSRSIEPEATAVSRLVLTHSIKRSKQSITRFIKRPATLEEAKKPIELIDRSITSLSKLIDWYITVYYATSLKADVRSVRQQGACRSSSVGRLHRKQLKRSSREHQQCRVYYSKGASVPSKVYLSQHLKRLVLQPVVLDDRSITVLQALRTVWSVRTSLLRSTLQPTVGVERGRIDLQCLQSTH